MHCRTQAVRRVHAERDDVLHFAQVIKLSDGTTFFWALRSECENLGPSPSGFDISVATLMNQIAERRRAQGLSTESTP
jgi:hypothetical protein